MKKVKPYPWIRIPGRAFATRAAVYIISLVILALLGYVDMKTGDELSVSLFYLAPVALIVWFEGFTNGVLFSILSVVVIFVSNRYSPDGIETFSFAYVWNNIAILIFYVIAVFAIWLLKKTLARERMLATTDTVTGLYNSRFFSEEAEREMERSRRFGHPLSMVFIDCDNFKRINDTYGHHAGDRLIRLVADELAVSVRSIDMVSRLGGDEFAILLPETDGRTAKKHFGYIRDRLRKRMDENEWNVTFSIGIATFLTPPDSVDEMIKRADALMYMVKKAGKDNIRHKVYR